MLTRDERAAAVRALRIYASLQQEPAVYALADKLEAEPEGAERLRAALDTIAWRAERSGANGQLAVLQQVVHIIAGEARASLQGVERTHALVPVTHLRSLQSLAALQGEAELAQACDATARGEAPVWPS